jgi:iron complex outermembrane receptor protein
VVTGITANVPEATVKGAEMSFEIVAIDGLRIGTNVAYTDAVFNEPVATVLGEPLVFTQYADTPRWTGTVYASASLPVLSSTGDMTFRAEAYSQTRENFSSIDLPGTTLPGYTTVNLRYDWQNIMQSKASVSLYVKNLLDRDYFAGGFALGATIGENLAIAGAPRMFGVELNYKY